MWDLIRIVIPRILNDWEYVADCFRYDLFTIRAIKEKNREDPRKCCREFFEDWLTTNHGARAGPKTWSTLISVLQEVDEISPDIIEYIVTSVKQLGPQQGIMSIS